jgi:6-pyruvoyltetrahydropterin/6-carboxytetrahydropterin synthase
LNDFPPFDTLNPSAENIAKYIYDEVLAGLGSRDGVRLAFVKLWETDTSSATYRLAR